jgi:V/A-type H+-transporting ATPase subunit G/H
LSRTDILEEIKKTEASAAAKVEKAEADKKIAIADARRNSVKKIQDAEAQMRSSYESSLIKEKEALAVKRDALLAEGKKEAEKIDKAAISKMQTVKDFLNEEVVRTLNVNV